MTKEVKYVNQVWGDPIAGERLSTNGHYTGEHKGTPLQGLGEAEANADARYTEAHIVRLGTMLQDAIEGSTPDVAE